jgi:hypothetical protein
MKTQIVQKDVNKKNSTAKTRFDYIDQILKEQQEAIKKLDKQLDMTQKIIHVEVASNAWRIEDQLKKKVIELHDAEMNKLDNIVGELQTLREESTIGAYHTQEIRGEIEIYKKRITALEKLQRTPHD